MVSFVRRAQTALEWEVAADGAVAPLVAAASAAFWRCEAITRPAQLPTMHTRNTLSPAPPSWPTNHPTRSHFACSQTPGAQTALQGEVAANTRSTLSVAARRLIRPRRGRG